LTFNPFHRAATPTMASRPRAADQEFVEAAPVKAAAAVPDVVDGAVDSDGVETVAVPFTSLAAVLVLPDLESSVVLLIAME
jgi:uncharacterized MAPEG superfamily protein